MTELNILEYVFRLNTAVRHRNGVTDNTNGRNGNVKTFS